MLKLPTEFCCDKKKYFNHFFSALSTSASNGGISWGISSPLLLIYSCILGDGGA